MSPKPFEPLPIDAPISARPGVLDHALANVLAAFTNCVLVPVPSGVDADTVRVPLIDEAVTPECLSRLATNNVAVVLGPRSQGMLAIKFTDRAGLTAFVERNPASGQTLITEHAGGPVIWHTADVAHRLPLDLPGCTVQMVGNVMVFDRAGVGRADAFFNRAKPTCVNLQDIEWGDDPDGTIAAWLAVLTHGDFFRRGGRGQQIPNTHAWRAYLAARLKPTTAYDTGSRRFYHRGVDADWRPVTDAHLRDELRRLVHAAPVGTTEARARISDEWLSRLCSRLKSSLGAQLQNIEDRTRAYLQQHLIKSPGDNVTNGELYADYKAHCNQADQPLLSPMKFRQLIGAILRGESWQAGYSKSIRRPGGQQNGWRGVRLRDQNQLLVTTHGADGAVGVKS